MYIGTLAALAVAAMQVLLRHHILLMTAIWRDTISWAIIAHSSSDLSGCHEMGNSDLCGSV
jgi:hypothetical protein